MRTYTKHIDDEITRIYFNGGSDDTKVYWNSNKATYQEG
jgi:hypothetical protein